MRSRKSPRMPVVVDGLEVGSLYLRYRKWWFDCRANGVRRFLNLRTGDIEEAIRRAKVEAEKAPPIPTAGVLANSPRPKTLEDALEAYEDEYRKEYKKTSLDRMLQTVRPFVASVGPTRPPYVITRAKFKELRGQLAERIDKGEITPATANGELRRAKAFANWLRQEELIEDNPTFKIRRFKEHTVALEAPSPIAVENLLEKFQGMWLHDFALVLAEVGLRPSEALHVRACDVDSEKRLLHICAWGDWTVKDYEFRKLALNPTAYAVLLRLRVAAANPEAVLFPNSEGNPLEYHNFKTQHWRPIVGRKAAVTPYGLRHYFASRAAMSGWPVERLSKYLGHADLQTTLKYYADIRALSEVGAPPETTNGRAIAAE